MKLLLIGPYPPPHGGISVHVRNAHAILSQAGIRCGVLNTASGAITPGSLFGQLWKHVSNDWTCHVHTNGHNRKSWMVAMACGFAVQTGAGGVLTLHSGLLPEYLKQASANRTAARLACLLYQRVVCVSEDIAETIHGLGVPSRQITVMPAFLPTPPPQVPIPDSLASWIAGRAPVISTALSFRPEYGFEVLVAAVRRLRYRFPRLGCVVMGGGNEKSAAEAEIQGLGLAGHFLLTGDLQYGVCLRVMSASDLFVRPTYGDGDANSVREAISLGVPVVASAVGCRPAGVALFQPGDDAGLADAIEQTVNRGRGAPAPGAVSNYAKRLMALYG